MSKKYFPTGNEYLAVPTINEIGEIESINYLSMKSRGLIEICGEPFIKPVIIIDGKEKDIEDMNWRRDKFWIPSFEGRVGSLIIEGKYITPLNRKGMILRLTISNGGKRIDCLTGIKGDFSRVMHSINESKEIKGDKAIYRSDWNKGFMFDFRTGITMFSFGFLADDGFDHAEYSQQESILFELYKKVELESEEKKTVDIFMGLGLEEVGAATQAVGLKRETTDYLIEEMEDWLQERINNIEDPYLDRLLHLNQFFNYFYASGKTLDTEELVLCTSRSPRYYVSAAYWDRDSLLWSYPSFLMMDKEFAKEVIDYVFKRQIKNAGIHSRYIDGTVLEPGFELDELCAFILALDNYLKESGEWEILNESHIKSGIYKIYRKLIKLKHDETDLYETFLMPTDDMHIYKYLTYDNVLVWRTFDILHKIYSYYNRPDLAKEMLNRRDAIKAAIYENLTFEDKGKRMFVWSSDLKGNCDFYDEPPGSLTLFEYYGFVEKDDEIFKNTYNYLYSDKFKHYFKDTEFEELGCSHASYPWILAICNSMLNGRKKEAYDMLKRTKLDNYIACESIDQYTGECATGAHFATCAGFLSYSINYSWRKTK